MGKYNVLLLRVLVTILFLFAVLDHAKCSPVKISHILEAVNQCVGANNHPAAQARVGNIDLGGLVRGLVAVNGSREAIVENLKTTKVAMARIANLSKEDPRSFMKQAELLNCSSAVFLPPFARNQSMSEEYPLAFLQWHTAYMHFLQRILGRSVTDPNFLIGSYWDPNYWPGINPNITTINQLIQHISRDSNSSMDMFNPNAVLKRMRQISQARPLFRSGIDVQGNLTGMLFSTAVTLVQEQGFTDPNQYLHHGMISRIWIKLYQIGYNQTTRPPLFNMSFILFDENANLVQVQLM